MNGNDDIDNERSGLISNAAAASQSAIPEVPLCGFLTVQYYQPFFDVDTVDISNRILASTFFCRREQNFVTMIGDKPDAYGPIWVRSHAPLHRFCLQYGNNTYVYLKRFRLLRRWSS